MLVEKWSWQPCRYGCAGTLNHASEPAGNLGKIPLFVIAAVGAAFQRAVRRKKSLPLARDGVSFVQEGPFAFVEGNDLVFPFLRINCAAASDLSRMDT